MAPVNPTDLVFVYGSLLRGLPNHHVIDQGEPQGTGTVQGRLVDLGYFPGLTPAAGRVLGELYAVTGETLSRLDALEGHPHFYRRDLVPVATDQGERWAWAYFYQGGRGTPIEPVDGLTDWRVTWDRKTAMAGRR